MGEKSHVSMGAAVCPICLVTHQTGEVLLHRRLEPVLDRETVTGFQRCEDCAKLKEEYVSLVVVSCPDHRVPSDEDRTGEIIHLRRAVFEDMFDVPIAEEGWSFCSEQVAILLKHLQQISEEAEGEEE